MKTICLKTVTIIILAFVFNCFGTSYAQNDKPEWMTKLPVKKGFVYGAGVGKSANLPMASDKARMDALMDLTNNYSGKFESFSLKCDTILGADNKVRQIITTVTSSQQATLTGVEVVEKVVGSQDGGSTVFMLLRLDVSNDVKRVQQEVEADAELRKKMSKTGLLKDLKGL